MGSVLQLFPKLPQAERRDHRRRAWTRMAGRFEVKNADFSGGTILQTNQVSRPLAQQENDCSPSAMVGPHQKADDRRPINSFALKTEREELRLRPTVLSHLHAAALLWRPPSETDMLGGQTDAGSTRSLRHPATAPARTLAPTLPPPRPCGPARRQPRFPSAAARHPVSGQD
jgi:hypothetical protein